ncbi:MAG: DAK2 domain-containing protein [Dehalococcoidia bacterium]
MKIINNVKNANSFNGKNLTQMFIYSKYYLEKHVDTLNSLNVFPVPDGDTGTNMLITIREVLKSIKNDNNPSASHISKTMSEAALMGAKGNSGVILSQFFKGFESALKSKHNFGYEEFVISLEYAVEYCYKSVGTPTEGTILTIINVAAKTARKLYENGTPLNEIITHTCKDVKTSVLKTPESLEVLKNAGVIDSGALGLYIILEGIRIYLEGGDLKSSNIDFPENLNKAPINLSDSSSENMLNQSHDKYGNCVQFFILSNTINIDEVKKEIEKIGSSLVVVGSDTKIKIHVHSESPDKLIKIASKFGEITQISIEDMDEQHQQIISKEKNTTETLLFSISSGEKINNIFTEFGAINFDIQENNYTKDKMESIILKSKFKNAILLMNGFTLPLDSKIFSNKFIHILNTNNIADGIAAILNYNPELMIDENISNMESSYKSIISIEIDKAKETTELYEEKLQANEYFSLYNKKLISKNNNILIMLNKLFKEINVSDKDLITIYNSKEMSRKIKETISNHMETIMPDAELEIIEGEFTSPILIISIE